MNPVIKNTLAVITGCILGGIINMAIVMISSSIIPPPDGADVTTIEGLKASMHLFQPRHFIMPFLAHSIGTFAGAFFTALIAANRKMTFALIIGIFSLIGGISNIFMLPSPTWFTILDLTAAYIPTAYIAAKFVIRKVKKNRSMYLP